MIVNDIFAKARFFIEADVRGPSIGFKNQSVWLLPALSLEAAVGGDVHFT